MVRLPLILRLLFFRVCRQKNRLRWPTLCVSRVRAWVPRCRLGLSRQVLVLYRRTVYVRYASWTRYYALSAVTDGAAHQPASIAIPPTLHGAKPLLDAGGARHSADRVRKVPPPRPSAHPTRDRVKYTRTAATARRSSPTPSRISPAAASVSCSASPSLTLTHTPTHRRRPCFTHFSRVTPRDNGKAPPSSQQ